MARGIPGWDACAVCGRGAVRGGAGGRSQCVLSSMPRKAKSLTVDRMCSDTNNTAVAVAEAAGHAEAAHFGGFIIEAFGKPNRCIHVFHGKSELFFKRI